MPISDDETRRDTVTITYIPPSDSGFIVAEPYLITQGFTVIKLDSVAGSKVTSIRIVTPFARLESRVVNINNQALTITIDLTKSDISLSTGLLDSLEYEICNQFGCDRDYIKVLREGTLVPSSSKKITTNGVYNFLSPNDDGLNNHFFFDIAVTTDNSSTIIYDIVTDNESSGDLLRNGEVYTDVFNDLIKNIEVLIFNRWGDPIISYSDYFGGQAYVAGELTNEVVSEEYVWKGKDINGEIVSHGTYYYYVKIYTKEGEDFSTNGFIEVRN